MRTDSVSQKFVLSVLDSDQDEVLAEAPIRASDSVEAWKDAVVIAFRACQGSGAVPMTITLVRTQTPNTGS